MFDTVSSVVTVVVLIILSLFMFSSAKSETIKPNGPPEFPGRYAEFYRGGEVELESYYQYVLTRREDRYIYRRFFPETKTLTLYEEYTDELLSTRHGVYEQYWDTGKPKRLGGYRYGAEDGRWETYWFNGNLQEEGSYRAGNRVGEWLSYHSNGQLAAANQYLDNELHGTCTSYDTSGTLIYTATYRDGELVEETTVGPGHQDFAYSYGSDEHSTVETFKIIEEMPLFPGCRRRRSYATHKACADRKLLKFIYSNLRYPDRAGRYGVTGEAKVSFVIERDGSISTIRVLEGLSEDITNELIRLIELMPDWIPGKQDGEVVRVQFNLPVRFYL